MDERSQFLADAAAQRKERELNRVQTETTLKLQALARGYLARKKFVSAVRSTTSEKFSAFVDLEKSEKVLLSNDEVLKWSRLFLRILRLPDDNEVLALLVPDTSYFHWTPSRVISDIISTIPQSLMYISGNRVTENSLFLASNEHKPLISGQALNALFSILFKSVKNDENLLPIFISHVLTCPAIVVHLNKANLDNFLNSELFDRCLTYLRSSPELVESIEPQKTINLLGNVIHLGYLDEETVKNRIVDWTWVIGLVMAQCTEFAVRPGEQSSHNHWHPIFGHYRLPIDPKLWKKLGGGSSSEPTHTAELEKDIPPTLAAIVCQLYMTALSTMTNMKNEIIAGICREDRTLRQLWSYLVRWGNQGRYVSSSSTAPSPLNAALSLMSCPQSLHAAPLMLFADAAAIVISILDEEELYERAVPFALEELVHIARFCNYFCFRAVWTGYVDDRSSDHGLFASIHQLCMVLHVRDSRRSFVNDPKFWLAPDVKSSILMGEFEKKTPRGVLLMRRMSHLVSLKERMLLFRKFVSADKNSNESSATLITGLDEAGIDQDGVFKEFLELTIKKVFDPALNLFHSTAAGVLYPSATSSVHEDHLALFQFVGRILAKAVYEGIVVDVQLAPVLLAAVRFFIQILLDFVVCN
ncbi:hypothetical protein KIN20_026372 [Parelaphostrongylus tenuis]|uniref:HECT-type E3 ubiquitin transferase n=1 Tax=Parelaphostrongylus tenuis TaxID=148309 RepID=A0AAD5WD05_PARTN|nr:hypothetical protein KIN20_026372 [Parelaphostrongylus tenuis]